MNPIFTKPMLLTGIFMLTYLFSHVFQEMMHRIYQDTLRRTWALVTIKDARLVNYVILICLLRNCISFNQ